MKRLMLSIVCAMIAILLLACSETGIPSDEQVIEAYHSAWEAASWFEISTIHVDYNVSADLDEIIYNKVTEFNTYDEFREYLLTLFSPHMVDGYLGREYLGSRTYIDYNGELYAIDMARGTDNSKGGENYEIIKKNNNTLILRVTVKLLDYGIHGYFDAHGEVIGSEAYDYPFEKINDRWVFTSFQVYK